MLSLLFWSLALVIAVKYVVFVLRADNEGEGGILALMAKLNPWGRGGGTRRGFVIVIGLFGCSLLFGDGVITPAVSVLSALEGIKTVFPAFGPGVVWGTVGILVALFCIQRKGTHTIGRVFGPVMLVWFLVQGALGAVAIARNPVVLEALNPLLALEFFARERMIAVAVFGAVFLALTGGEAMYADLGHCGRRPITAAWFSLVMPSLLLNYFGQGADALAGTGPIDNPFFDMAPEWMRLPMVGLATCATVIASQALISGVFSLVRQAITLGVSPRFNVIQTFRGEYGQIYVPAANWALMIGCIMLVLAFRSSDALASAYGVAVSMTMLITTVLMCVLMRIQWGWGVAAVAAFAIPFGVIDSLFVVSNLIKVMDGGWITLVVGATAFLLMTTWERGSEILVRRLAASSIPFDRVSAILAARGAARIGGTSFFLTKSMEGIPPLLCQYVSKTHAVSERVVIVNFQAVRIPFLEPGGNTEVFDLGDGFWRVKSKYGYMQIPDLDSVMTECGDLGLRVDTADSTIVLGHETISRRNSGSEIGPFTAALYGWMVRNAARADQFFRLPKDRVLEVGVHVEL